jgi:excisionase family DNA binding protein
MTENSAAGEPPKLYTMEEAADVLRLSRTTVFRMHQRGKLRVVKFGRRTLVEASEIGRVIREAAA